MIRLNSRCVLPILVVGFVQLLACSSTNVQNRIYLDPSDDGQHLKVTYRLSQPTSAIVFARTPDESRSRRWRIVSSGFEIARANDKDMIRRADGVVFSTVDVMVPATYVPLPKDYAPFSPFSDGSLLVHSGRFHACPAGSADDCEGPWPMQVEAPHGKHILLHGNKYQRSAKWSDSDSGTKIYIGTADAFANADFVQIVDPALPPAISELISTSLPEVMQHLAQRLPPLTQRPMLFASYDPDFKQGHGRQGGTLPNQVFMHFYGSTWEKTGSNDNTPEDIAWFFAHEAGHLFQHGVTGNLESSWIHEGAADAFAYLSLGSLGNVPREYLDTRRQQARESCRDALGNGVLANAAERGRFSDYYHCGLIMFIAIDQQIRVNSNGQQDLFSFWATLIPESQAVESWSSAEFLNRAENWIGRDAAQQLLSLAVDKQNNPDEALARLAAQ